MNDYIKREDALMAILALEDRDIPEDRYPDTEFAFNEGLVHAANKVNDIPAADVVERKRGEWVSPFGIGCVCNRCGYDIQEHGIDVRVDGEPNYCPNCGADMRGES